VKDGSQMKKRSWKKFKRHTARLLYSLIKAGLTTGVIWYVTKLLER
jgi:hypothetical protein